ncbi:hypothetical protein TNIN_499041 [Trichonephila inaurata madagascariensis]|uniref:Uncharacterized protein n=1 Tax=Trichonephila inaurata madagascariensis TaxID=2747483 RepID=A0A8X6WQ02_9ARAC|nr:hypothetical protein TNIN_499041 [Trichonephila inaurata madagascariensis]
MVQDYNPSSSRLPSSDHVFSRLPFSRFPGFVSSRLVSPCRCQVLPVCSGPAARSRVSRSTCCQVQAVDPYTTDGHVVFVLLFELLNCISTLYRVDRDHLLSSASCLFEKQQSSLFLTFHETFPSLSTPSPNGKLLVHPREDVLSERQKALSLVFCFSSAPLPHLTN